LKKKQKAAVFVIEVEGPRNSHASFAVDFDQGRAWTSFVEIPAVGFDAYFVFDLIINFVLEQSIVPSRFRGFRFPPAFLAGTAGRVSPVGRFPGCSLCKYISCVAKTRYSQAL